MKGPVGVSIKRMIIQEGLKLLEPKLASWTAIFCSTVCSVIAAASCSGLGGFRRALGVLLQDLSPRDDLGFRLSVVGLRNSMLSPEHEKKGWAHNTVDPIIPTYSLHYSITPSANSLTCFVKEL